MLPGCPGSRVSMQARGGCCVGTRAIAEGPCPRRAERKSAYIPLLCYGCRLTFKELVRLLVCSGVFSVGTGAPYPQLFSYRVLSPHCRPMCVLRPSAGSTGNGDGGDPFPAVSAPS